ncbi:conserved hypothetical protein [Cognatiyoonia koreensis]|uniref:DUF4139 domain-containing protein n=1 Tax=Cognatiyoonia koreensis TaxID=364200 RepID=A0A1I0REB8_9RHOB|nr:DUF4139 domain-containing protein [Cognatiyoonia koreensis]SEW39228.1 conserved hypothetical protein [Cognatiyoonia koreensis]
MRLTPIAAATFAVTAQIVSAETFVATADPTAVTIYPSAASVLREATIDLPAGNHTIIVPNLPAQLRAEFVEVTADQGITIGAVNLATGRMPALPDTRSENVLAAQAEVDRLQEVLRQSDVAISEIRLRSLAAEEQVAFLRGLTATTTDPDDVGAVQALADMVGAEILVLRRSAFAAEQEALAAERAQADDRKALATAEQALAALIAPSDDRATLTFAVDVAEATSVGFDITSIEGEASWAPDYNLRLTTGDSPTLLIERNVVISQSTGQDWVDVALILSTAEPSGRATPYRAFGERKSIISEEEYLARQRLDTGNSGGLAPAVLEAPVVVADIPATVSLSRRSPDGIAASYDYPRPVSIRNGVEDLRLPLDELTFDATQRARAVPAKENVAYRMVKFTNGDDILLDGPARYFANGVLVGFDDLRRIQPGQTTEIGFGGIQGLLTKRNAPNLLQGAVGIIAQENQRNETVTLTLENLTTEDWQIQVFEGAPYSEQTDLEITYTADPDYELSQFNGQRGVLEWTIDLAAGEETQIIVDYALTWPSGFRLE